MIDAKDISPTGIYTFAEAVKLIPSCQTGRTLHVATLYRWQKAGLVRAHKAPGRRGWYVFGSELLRLLHADPLPVPVSSRSPAQERKALDQAMANHRRRGSI